jgi:hypothetical protein
MKLLRFFTLILSFHAFATILANAENLDTLLFKHLNNPTYPGFVIVGSDPSNIASPSTPQEISAAINNLSNKNNYGIEIAPFKLLSKSEKFNIFYSNFDWLNILKSTSFSFVSTETKSFDSLLKGKTYGIGFKTTLINGSASRKAYLISVREKFKRNKDSQDILLSITNIVATTQELTIDDLQNLKYSNRIQSRMQTQKILAPADYNCYFELLQPYINDILNTTKLSSTSEILDLVESNIAQSLQRYINDSTLNWQQEFDNTSQKLGFFLELAGAVALNIQDSSDIIDFRRSALWLTPTYRWQCWEEFPSSFDASGVFRYLYDKRTDRDYIDMGLKGQLTIDKLTMSVECIYRNHIKDNYRAMGLISYKADELLNFNINFGKDFVSDAKLNRWKIDFGISGGFGSLLLTK